MIKIQITENINKINAYENQPENNFIQITFILENFIIINTTNKAI